MALCAYVTGCVLQTTSSDKLKSDMHSTHTHTPNWEEKNKTNGEKERVRAKGEKKNMSGPVKCTTNEINLFILSI